MAIRKLLLAAVVSGVTLCAGVANAGLVFVGSWRLNDGPADAVAASARQVAAQLFGGSATDYAISTGGAGAGDIDFLAWYEVLGLPGAVFVGDQDATDFAGFNLSAYAFDPELTPDQDRFVNYAFRDDVAGPGIPEPATWALTIAGFGLTGAMLRRRRAERA